LVTAGGTGDNAYVFGAEYGNIRYIKGTIPANSDSFCVKGNLHDPPRFAGQLIKEALESRNLPIMGSVITDRELNTPIDYKDAGLKEIGRIESPKLKDIITVINQLSNNLYAEHVHKAISAHKTGLGSNSNSNDIIKSHWVAKGLDAGALFVTDGSGLSRSNAISTTNLVKMLMIVAKDKTSSDFKKSLPVAGKSGTLRNMCKGTKAEGNVMAKSGTMTRVKGYAGYVNTASGRPVVFAMLFNNYACSNNEITKKIEKLMVKMAELK
jgi:D-alanyl-D-alanine carboxypeptidase/D-alanyl-D-alanine-endopeptidase (penicillin-binding protein 4)